MGDKISSLETLIPGLYSGDTDVTHSGNTQECTSLDGLDSLRCTTGQVLSSAMTGILHSHTTKENIGEIFMSHSV
jgi:hypothetical protein